MSTRVAVGRLADGTIGLRIAKAGFDANANPPPAPANLIFDSAWPALLPILQAGVLTIGGNGSASAALPKLGYIPLFSYMLNASGGSFTQGWTINQAYNTQYYKNPKAVQAPASYLQIWIADGSFNAYAYTSGSDQAWPGSFSIGYVVYKVAG